MSTSDNEKCENKSKIDYDELPKLKTKIVNKEYTREILKYYIKQKEAIIDYLKEKLKKEEKKLQVLECDLEKFYLSRKINEK